MLSAAPAGSPRQLPQLARGAAIQRSKACIESADTAEPGGQRGLREWQIGLIDQCLGKMKTARLHDGYWSRAEVLQEKPA
jgi:hypothetical protein